MAYALGPVKPWVKDAALKVGPMFGIASIGGYRASARDMGGHPAGLALDFMVNSQAQGERLAAYVQANAAALNVEYVIWWQHIWSVARSSEGWRAMEDRGSATENHHDHVHVNFNSTAGGNVNSLPDAGNANVTNANYSNVGLNLGGIGDAISGTTKIVSWWLNPENLLRVAAFVAGVVLLIIGISRMANVADHVTESTVKIAKEVIS
jgi:hypothetical protein